MTFDPSLRSLGLSLGAFGLIAACTVDTTGTGSQVTDESSADLDDTDPDDTDLADDSAEPDLPVDCGNGQIDPGEACDGAALAGQSCVGLGWDHGALDCAIDCQFELGDCSNDPQPGLGELYSPCLDNTDCPGLEGCLTLVDEAAVVIDGFCTNFCLLDDECAGPTGGSAVAVCKFGLQNSYCALDCEGGLTCPDGMACAPVEPAGELCF